MFPYYFNFDFTFRVFLLIFFVVVVVLLASNKKQNVLYWGFASFFGYIIISFFSSIIARYFFSNMDYLFYPIREARYAFYSLFSRLLGFAPVLYEFVLIGALLILPSKQNQFMKSSGNNYQQNPLKCNRCGTSVERDMRYCPYCGNQL